MTTESMRKWRQEHPREAYELNARMWANRDPEAVRASRKRSQAKRYRHRRDALNAMKVAEGCADCGYNAHPAALDFDHVRGIKLFGVGKGILSHTWAQTLAEIAKCEVVCANCHRVRTHVHRSVATA